MQANIKYLIGLKSYIKVYALSKLVIFFFFAPHPKKKKKKKKVVLEEPSIYVPNWWDLAGLISSIYVTSSSILNLI